MYDTMKVGIMQPYFFPYIGYISLIKHTDKFILFDEVQFTRHGWIERNRILKQNEGWIYIKVPMKKHGRDTLIKDIEIDNSQDWKNKILSQLQHYKKSAPNYFKVIKLLSDVFEKDYSNIVSLNKATLETVIIYLGLNRKIDVFSEMELEIEEPNNAGDWALNICKAIPEATEYWNPSGGKEIFDKDKFEKEKISLLFHEIALKPYDQRRGIFESGLSIIDVMMFNDVKIINMFLDQFSLS